MDAINTIAEPELLQLGASLPPGDPHGISVHLPKWADTVGWAAREARVVDAMKTGYPRFFIPRVVDQLVARLLRICGRRAGLGQGSDGGKPGGKLGLLFATRRHATICRRTLLSKPDAQPGKLDIGRYAISWDGKITMLAGPGQDAGTEQPEPSASVGQECIYLVSYPPELGARAKSFWQHTGFGISSRRATYWLERAPFLSEGVVPEPRLSSTELSLQVDQAKAEIKRRIATGHSAPSEGFVVSDDDVFLFHTGMTAMAEAVDAVKALHPPTSDSPPRLAVFGFPYVDTFKVLSHALNLTPTLYQYTDLPTFTTALCNPQPPPFTAMLTEFPSNPLLHSPPLPTLHTLSLTHALPLLVDDTLGTAAALRLLPSCTLLCTSLAKMFSGQCNVMGGAVTLNPRSPFHAALQRALRRHRPAAEAAWFGEDVLVMERNSRRFDARAARASSSAARVVRMLRGAAGKAVVAEVYYPLGAASQGVYDLFRREGGGYGFLVAVRFATAEQARVFYDAFDVAKGPSLGTDFTLCCAYTLLAHYKELGWAAEYGVVEDLVRISVGLEEWAWLEERVGRALRAAEHCGQPSRR
ncbi:PLP-dependent transferase [Trichocladium antarcticum]|uniref:PLP-dependent transferase n=1 Tax=Trichocladium antarcticum TaxID=1450529 RepID=A0AAN6UNP5_9PEZI|nr:PLP-dependent transferase [Trichocladium antarcticum]